MGLCETAYGIRTVGILESIAVFACLRRPEMHAERHAGGRIGVAVAQSETGIGALKRVDISGIIHSGGHTGACTQ